MRLRTVVVGLGNIGMGYDLSSGSPDTVMTHVRALRQNPVTYLSGAVDPDRTKLKSFEDLTQRPGFESIISIGNSDAVNLAIIASPTNKHLDTIEVALGQFDDLRAILCEKPLHCDEASARRIVQLCRERGVKLYVNYFRRCEPSARNITNRINSGSIRGPFKGVAWYSKGIRHNGTHLLDLLSSWLGSPLEFRILSRGRDWPDEDMEVDFVLRFDQGEIHFISLADDQHDINAIELFASNGNLRYGFNDLVSWQPSSSNPFVGVTKHTVKAEELFSDFSRYQAYVTQCLVEVIRGINTPICSGQEAADLVRLANQIIKSARDHA